MITNCALIKQKKAKITCLCDFCFLLFFLFLLFSFVCNRPRSIYQYSNMAPRLSGQNSIVGVVFFVSKSLLGIERQKKLEKFAILTRKPRSHARILIYMYRTWPIRRRLRSHFKNSCFVFHRGFQTLENNKSTQPTASCFHQFSRVWKPR